TNWAITQSNRFAAAVTDRCVSEWMSFYYSTDFTLFRPACFRKPPVEDPQESIERSPATYASRVTTPPMIIHSAVAWSAPPGRRRHRTTRCGGNATPHARRRSAAPGLDRGPPHLARRRARGVHARVGRRRGRSVSHADLDHRHRGRCAARAHGRGGRLAAAL